MRRLFIVLSLLAASVTAHAVELKISADALERTLARQLFTDNGRYFIRGKADTPCFVYAEDPKITFVDDRIIVHVKTHAKLGTAIKGACIGVSLNTEADMSVLPEAENETIGFRDPRVDKLSESKELNYFLLPFLSKKLPQEMKVNAADIIRQLIANSTQTTGYTMTLDTMKIHSMQVTGNVLVVDFDGALSVK